MDKELEIPSFMTGVEYQKRRELYRYKLSRQESQKFNHKSIKRRDRFIVRSTILLSVLGITLTVSSAFFKSLNYDIPITHIEEFDITNDDIEPVLKNNTVNISFEEMDTYALNEKIEVEVVNNTNIFNIGSKATPEWIATVLDSEMGQLFVKYGEMYGIDPYLLIAKSMQESSLNHDACIPGGYNYNGYGVGVSQIECPNDNIITAHNYITNSEDSMVVSMENACDLECNIKIGAMLFQKCLENSNGNILLAIQSYNYGTPMVSLAINKYSEQTSRSAEEIKSDYSDVGWLSIIEDMHNNPNNYINWNGSTYGDSKYIEHVLSYFANTSTYYYCNGNKCEFDFNTLSINNYETVNNKIY